MDVDFSDNSLTRTKVFGGDDVKFNKLSKDYSFCAHMDPIKNITLSGPRGLMITTCRVNLLIFIK